MSSGLLHPIREHIADTTVYRLLDILDIHIDLGPSPAQKDELKAMAVPMRLKRNSGHDNTASILSSQYV